MKIGDKIRFLSTTGGGIVRGFKGKDLAVVEDADGFDIPVLIRECVVIEPAHDNQVRQSSMPSETVVQQAVANVANRATDTDYKRIEETKEGELITACIAYLPVDIKTLSTSNYECYLVNDSNYYLSYNLANRSEGMWNSRCTGVVEPNTKVFLEEVSKDILNDLERMCIQLFAYKVDKPFALKNPYSVELRLDTVKFYKLHSFSENDYFDDGALIVPVVKKDLPVRDLVIDTSELELAMKERESEQQREPQRPRVSRIEKKGAKEGAKVGMRERTKEGKQNEIMEIDLHINELLDNTNGLSSRDILEYQLKTFKEAMDENAKNKGQKIVFIHGKGDGVLKTAILKELTTNYRTAYYQDASFSEYGYGATMITIK